MSLKNRVWLLCGIGLGLLLPLVVKSYEVLTLNSVRPICVWLLWPTSILLRFAGFATGIRASVLFLATVVGNAILFGFAAALLRRAFIGLVLLMALLIFLFLPPSDSSLAAQFEKHRPELQRLVDMANSDTQVVGIGPTKVETINGTRSNISGGRGLLTEDRLAEYRQLFTSAGLNDGLYKSFTGGDVFLIKRAIHQVDPLGSSIGYLYCNGVHQQSSFLPCMEGRESGDKNGYRWKKLDSSWYIYEVFQRGIE